MISAIARSTNVRFVVKFVPEVPKMYPIESRIIVQTAAPREV